MATKTSGFTLIELMITVAIIGVLAAISIPMYQSYVPKTQVTRVVSELGGYRALVEDALGSSTTPSNDLLGFAPTELITETLADPIASMNPDGSGQLRVTLGGNAHQNVTGVTITMERDVSGGWECVIDNSANPGGWHASFLPRGCRL